MTEKQNFAARNLEKLRTSRKIQKRIALAVVVALLCLAGMFVYELMPRHYSLSISGGSLLGNRHYLAKILSEESAKQDISLRVVPTTGALEALELIEEGKLDLALIQSGLETNFQNVAHVATIAPELIHFMVKPGIESIKDIRGKTVNMGEHSSGSRILSKQILDNSGLSHGVDYVEMNYAERDLVAMQKDRLPDVIVLVSYAPSDVAEFLVRERGYNVLEMLFPPSLAIRLGWVADTKILGYMYSIVPPVPEKDIQVVGVNLHLVANKKTDPRAIAQIIDTLYGPRVSTRFGRELKESNMLLPSGYPISSGTELYLSRKAPLLTEAMIDKIKALFGLLATLISVFLVIINWFRKSPNDETSGADRSQDNSFMDHFGNLTDHVKTLKD